MADFSKSACCDCGDKSCCPDAFANFAAELCPKSSKGKDKNK